jgi:hypothetical protein
MWKYWKINSKRPKTCWLEQRRARAALDASSGKKTRPIRHSLGWKSPVGEPFASYFSPDSEFNRIARPYQPDAAF